MADAARAALRVFGPWRGGDGQLLRQHRPDLMVGEGLYRSPSGFTSWSTHWSKAVAVELAQEQSEQIDDHVAIWGGMVRRWARAIGAEPRFLSPALAQAFLQTEKPTLTPELPRSIACLRLLLPKGTLFSEEGPEIRSVVVADVRPMAGWLPDPTDFSPSVWVSTVSVRVEGGWPDVCPGLRPRAWEPLPPAPAGGFLLVRPMPMEPGQWRSDSQASPSPLLSR